MGNQQTVYTPLQQPYPIQQGIAYSAQTQIAGQAFPVITPGGVIVNNNDCCGPNVPQSLNCCTPSYGPGIANTPFVNQNNNDCCNCNGGAYSSVPGTVGYGQIGTIQQNQSIDQWCCGPSTYVAPTFTQPQIIPQQIATQVVQTTSVSNNAPLIISTIGTESLVREPVMNPIVNSIIQTEVFQPIVTPVLEVNPFNNLPNRIVTVIQQLGSVNPLRGSIMGRLETPQYVPQKQAYYEGQWINGYMQGFGRLYFDSGAYFEGEFVNGLAQTSHGLFIYPDGSYYIGGVDRNVANGQGEFNYRGGRLIYKGQFLNDQPDGHGVELYSDGSRYEGEFRFGKKEGRGQFSWKDGTVYTGQFENGFMQGEGIHKLSNGEVYEGEFRKNKRHGRGRHVSSLGTYIGGYKRDKKEGQGTFTWIDGKIFKGTFHNGKPDGQGAITIVDGTTVYGMWINGELDQNSLSTNNPFRGSTINPGMRGSIASVGSIGSNIQFGSAIGRTSQIVNGPPTINLGGGMLAGGFIGRASPFVNNRGSIVSVIGPGGDFRGSSIPRGSSVMIANSPINPIIRGSSISILPPNGPALLSSAIGRRPTGFPGPIRTSTVTSNISPIVPITPVLPVSPITPIVPGLPPRPTSMINPLSGVRPISTNPIIPSVFPQQPILNQQAIIRNGPGLNPFNQVNVLNNTTRVSSISPGIARTSQFNIGTPLNTGLGNGPLGVIPQINQQVIGQQPLFR